MKYISFDEYKELGGTVADETTFNSLQAQVESKMNYLTFGRLDDMYEHDCLPDEVAMLEVELIATFQVDSVSTVKTGVKSYSNGIESIVYGQSTNDDNIEVLRNKRTLSTMETYLWKYPELFYRGRSGRGWTHR